MKIKKVPMRMCIVTHERFEKKDLLRIVKNNEGKVFVDDTLKANGRGVYLKKDAEIIKKAQKSNAIGRQLEVEVDDKIYEELLSKI